MDFHVEFKIPKDGIIDTEKPVATTSIPRDEVPAQEALMKLLSNLVSVSNQLGLRGVCVTSTKSIMLEKGPYSERVEFYGYDYYAANVNLTGLA